MNTVKRLAIKGAAWVLVGYFLSQVLRLGGNLLLTRIIPDPGIFGLMTLVSTWITGLHLFTDIGLAPNVIQSKRGDEPRFLNTIWTLQVIRAVGIWGACLLLAFPVAWYYQQPLYRMLIPAVALGTLISGFNSTAVLTLERRLNQGTSSRYQLALQAISVFLTVGISWYYPSVWALVAAGLISALVGMIWSHFLLPEASNRFEWDPEAAHSVRGFAKWIFFTTAVTFLAGQSDRLMLGKMVPLAMLGVYGVALTLADVPRAVSLTLSSKVIFPALSRFNELPRHELRGKILRNRWPILLAFSILMSIPIAWGDRIVMFLYKPPFHEAAWMLPILCLGIWPRVLCNTNDPALPAIGQFRYGLFAQMTRFVCTAGGILIGHHHWGMPGIVIAVALSDVPYYVVMNYGLWKERLGGLRQDLQYSALLVIVCGAMLAARAGLGFGLPIARLLR